MRITASWFRSPLEWDRPNTRTWRAIYAATPGGLASDRLRFTRCWAVIATGCAVPDTAEPAAVLGAVKEWPGHVARR
jgi:hypothetical protein